MAPPTTSASAPSAPTAKNPTRVLLPVLCAIALCALLLPAPDETPLIAFVRQATIMTVASTGFPSCISAALFQLTGKTAEWGYICVPLGLVSGAVTATYFYSQRPLLQA